MEIANVEYGALHVSVHSDYLRPVLRWVMAEGPRDRHLGKAGPLTNVLSWSQCWQHICYVPTFTAAQPQLHLSSNKCCCKPVGLSTILLLATKNLLTNRVYAAPNLSRNGKLCCFNCTSSILDIFIQTSSGIFSI